MKHQEQVKDTELQTKREQTIEMTKRVMDTEKQKELAQQERDLLLQQVRDCQQEVRFFCFSFYLVSFVYLFIWAIPFKWNICMVMYMVR